MPKRHVFLWSVLCAAGLAGCGLKYVPSPRMTSSAPAPLAAVPDQATLVFVRPSNYAGVIIPSIFIDGKYVGDVEAERKLVVKVPPGDHAILAFPVEMGSKGCRQLTAKVEAGKLYFVESTVAVGAVLFAARTSDAARLTPWRAVPERKLDEAATAQAPLDLSDKAECEKDAKEFFDDADPEDKAKYVLSPADGFTAPP